jgi:hypothetical protein
LQQAIHSVFIDFIKLTPRPVKLTPFQFRTFPKFQSLAPKNAVLFNRHDLADVTNPIRAVDSNQRSEIYDLAGQCYVTASPETLEHSTNADMPPNGPAQVNLLFGEVARHCANLCMPMILRTPWYFL